MREVLGIGSAAKIDWLEIKWPQPSGRVERVTDLPIDRYVTIVEGKGKIRVRTRVASGFSRASWVAMTDPCQPDAANDLSEGYNFGRR